MNKGDADIEMNFKVGNAAQANAIMKSVYQNQQAGMNSVKRSANDLVGPMTLLSRTFSAFAGAAGIGSLLTASTQLVQSAEKIAAAQALMEKAITPLSSLGENAGNLPQLREQAAQVAASTGRSLEEAANMLFILQSTTGNLSDPERQDLGKNAQDMAEATGGGLDTSANLLVKAYQIYGKEVENVTELTNKLMHTQDAAAVSFQDLATRLPELAGAGQLVGASLDEVLASVIASTKRTGSVEKTFTGMRNAMLIMETAGEKGIKLTGDFTDKLSQLQVQFDKNPDGMRKLFGVENITTVKALVDALPDMNANEKILDNIDGSRSRADEIVAQRLQDPSHRLYRTDTLNKFLRENAPSLSGDTRVKSWLLNMKRRKDLGALATQYETGEGPGSISSFVGSTKGLLADPASLQRGREIEIQKVGPGPLQDALLREDFDARKKEELSAIYGRDMLTQTGLYYTKEERARIDEIKNTPFNIHAERGRYTDQYGESPSAPAPTNEYLSGFENSIQLFQKGEERLEQNTKAIEALTDSIQLFQKGEQRRVVAPGGARTNYQE